MLMAKGPKGEKRPADAVANTIHFMRIAKGEVEWKLPTPEAKGLGSASAALGRREPDDALDLTAGGASAARRIPGRAKHPASAAWLPAR